MNMRFGARSGPRRLSRMAGLMSGVALTIAGVGLTPAIAQDNATQAAQADRRNFNLPAQPLASALTTFGNQAGLQVTVDNALVRGQSSQAVVGSYTPTEALNRLLAGTGINWRWLDSGSVRLEKAPQAGNAIQLGAIRVEGAGGVAGGVRSGQGGQFGDGGDTGDLAYVSPQSSSYITRDELERVRGSQPSDMFRGTPGVLSGDARNSGALDLNIRGMQGQGRVPVVVDGGKQSTTVYRGYSGVADRTYIDPDMIGGVEVFKGPTSGSEGTGATGGVVSMRTINADDILLPGKTFGVRLKVGVSTNSTDAPEPFAEGGLRGAGTYIQSCNYSCGTITAVPTEFGDPARMDRPDTFEPTGHNYSLTVAKKWDRFDIVAGYAYRNSGNYFAGERGDNAPEAVLTPRRVELTNGRWREETVVTYAASLNRFRAGEEVLNTSSENESFLVKGRFQISETQAVEATVNTYKSHFGELMPSMIIRGDGAIQAPMSIADATSYSVRYKWAPSDLINLKVNWWHTALDNSINTAYEFFGFSFIQDYDARTHQTGIDVSNRSRFNNAWGELTLNYGLSHTHENTFQIPGSPALEGTDGDARDGKRTEVGAFADAEWVPPAAQWLKLYAATRYTKSELYDRKMPERGVEKYSGWAPIYAATVTPKDGWQIYARYAEAIRHPSIFERTRGWSFTPILTVDIKPEHAKNWEVGTNLSVDGLIRDSDQARFKLAYFDNHVINYLTRATSWNVDDLTDRGETLRNIDAVDFRGYEMTLEYRLKPVMVELFATRYVHSNFCYKDGVLNGVETSTRKFCYSGGLGGSYSRNHVPPKWSGGLNVGTKLLNDKLELFGRVTHIGSRPEAVQGAGAIAVVEWSPYTLLDLSASYRFNERVKVDFTADNVLDQYYMDALTIGLMASPGRTLRLNLTYIY
ncbi:MAG: TonB-dependent receptor [Asticcacaulis sp.]